MKNKNSLGILFEGNRRYAAGKAVRPNQSAEKRKQLADGQTPFACILSCSDSRVPPEIIFDQGLGDLFVLRIAGNVANEMIIGSLEYAVEHLGPRLIVVLGHSRCGAVIAAATGADVPANTAALIRAIQPAVDKAGGSPPENIDKVVRENVRLVTSQLVESSPLLREMQQTGKLEITGAFYDLDTGKVEILA